MIIINIVRFFYVSDEEYFSCEKVVYPNKEEVFMQDGVIDWSGMKNYIGNKYVIMYEGCIVEAGTIKDYYREDGVGTIVFNDEIGDMNKAFHGVDKNKSL